MDVKKNLARMMSVFTAFAVMLLAAVPAEAAGGKADKIEQIYVNMPEIRVYTPPSDELPKAENITGQYNDKVLGCKEIKKFSETGDGVDYYVLLDISGSLSSDTFNDMKKGIKYLHDNISEKDRFTLLTFGDNVGTAYCSDDSNADFKKIIDNLRAADSKTLLYHGLSEVIKLSDKSDFRRKECLIFTDGYDESVGEETEAEVKEQLNNKNIPVYAVAENKSKKDTDSLGQLARGSKGDIKVLGSTKSEGYVRQIVELVKNSIVMIFEAPDNIVDNSTVKFTVVNSADNTRLDRNVEFSHHRKDETAPEIKKVELTKKNMLKVTFSEEMQGAGKPENYSLINSSDKSFSPEKAAYESKSGSFTALLTFKDAIIKDDYKLVCRNMTDYSMEKNELSDSSFGLYIDGVEPETSPAPQVSVVEVESVPLPAVIAISVVIVLLIVGIAVLAVWRSKNRKTAEEEEAAPPPPPVPPVPVMPENGGARLVSDAPHYKVAQVNSDKIRFIIEMSNKQGHSLEIEFNGKLYVGRGKDCDFVVEDKFMARKQFLIEKTGFIYSISDLNSTNGTFLNGVRINSTRRLNNHDVITAGRMKITVELL